MVLNRRGDKLEYEKVPEETYKSLPPRKKTVEQIEREYRQAIERDHQLQSKWLLGLAIANGGALTALSAKTLDVIGKPVDATAKAAVALAVPCLWLFVVGFIAVGAALLQELIRNQNGAYFAHRTLTLHAARQDITTLDTFGRPTWKAWLPELLSAACFVGGLMYPLLVLGLRYFRNGEFSW